MRCRYRLSVLIKTIILFARMLVRICRNYHIWFGVSFTLITVAMRDNAKVPQETSHRRRWRNIRCRYICSRCSSRQSFSSPIIAGFTSVFVSAGTFSDSDLESDLVYHCSYPDHEGSCLSFKRSFSQMAKEEYSLQIGVLGAHQDDYSPRRSAETTVL